MMSEKNQASHMHSALHNLSLSWRIRTIVQPSKTRIEGVVSLSPFATHVDSSKEYSVDERRRGALLAWNTGESQASLVDHLQQFLKPPA